MRRTCVVANAAALYDFVDNNFLNNKRPAVPGGAWPLESLRTKSLADLQQIWLQLIRERNMLGTTKQHYLRHQEELGAMPAPSRLDMVTRSLENVRQVVRERDREATRRAVEIFRARLQRGVYRYPPGPPPPPGQHDRTSAVRVVLSRRVEPERLRELLGRYDVFEPHKGIVSIELRLPEDVLQRKQEAEQLWQEYMAEKSDVEEYYKWAGQDPAAPSVYDLTAVELAPGVCAGAEGSDTVAPAAALPVPPPQPPAAPPQSPLERIKYQRRNALSKATIQLGHFPNITLAAPRYRTVEEIPRPTHPDEIAGPWEVHVRYDAPDGAAYVDSLGLQSIDGAAVISVAAVAQPPQPHAAVDPVYQEALRREAAAEETAMQWPHVPAWKFEYDLYSKKHLSEIVRYNYSNVVDYVDREVLLTGRSVWECPIDIDPTCGGLKSVPAHAKPPKQYVTSDMRSVGMTDI
ncbi:hypothetical protein STCU_05710 [Strigomonas culicis]|uniref:Large ribosomal subunit protein uL29m n=1 Tax=Strigomonas culicis TaxID=28005 RepID=S9UFL5_9TRYP|nr:hypothetical protein STCU_05710 [Strigomonas culicis]|eukprot:EPY27519.1 hypothetical protein STCU_05710 [Strigomonas culicis]